MPKYPSLSYPDGWFAACYSHELRKGAVLARTLFDKQVVLFRSAAGNPAIIDAHCPHMGAHFGHGGRVEGETIRCPFHGFSFATDGTCVATPYASKIPPKCRAGAWPVVERDGFVLVWHHHRGEPPSWHAPTIDHSGWLAPLTRMWTLSTHPQETSENSVDLGHLGEVHGYSNLEILDELELEGPYLTIRYGMTRGRVRSQFRIHVHGLGFSFVETEVPGRGIEIRYWVMCTPTKGDQCELRSACSLKLERPAAVSPLLALLPRALVTRLVAKFAYASFCHDIVQDFDIWQHKTYVDPPVLARGDGPVGRYRRWCRQFYPSLPQIHVAAV